MVIGISALVLFIIKHNLKNRIQRIQLAIQYLNLTNSVNDDISEKAKQQYINLIRTTIINLKDKFETFCKAKTNAISLDKFYFDICSNKRYKDDVKNRLKLEEK